MACSPPSKRLKLSDDTSDEPSQVGTSAVTTPLAVGQEEEVEEGEIRPTVPTDLNAVVDIPVTFGPLSACVKRSTVEGERSPDFTREVDVGIELFIFATYNNQDPSSANLQRSFRGLIKHRYTDFLVHEIDQNGQVVRLTDISAPPEPTTAENVALDPSEAKELCEVAVQTLTNPPLSLKIELAERIAELAYCKRPPDFTPPSSEEDTSGNKTQIAVLEWVDIVCDTTDKTWRTEVHRAIKTIFGGRLASETLTPQQQKKLEKQLNQLKKLYQEHAEKTQSAKSNEESNQKMESETPDKTAADTTMPKTETLSTEPTNTVIRVFHSRSSGGHQSFQSVLTLHLNALSGKGKRKTGGEQRWPFDRPPYLSCVLYKENKDTMDALSVLSHLLHVRQSVWTFAGTKDKRGVTTQRIHAWHVDAGRLAALNSRLVGIKTGNYSYTSVPLRLGELKGNRFDILLRNIRLLDPDGKERVSPMLDNTNKNDPELLKEAEDVKKAINFACSILREVGFINYFGMQRFGTGAIPTHAIGRAILQSDWKRVVELILLPRGGEKPEMVAAREYYRDHPDAPLSEILAKFPKQLFVERLLLQNLKNPKLSGGCFTAFQSLPKSMRTMYVHAYQSYIWNRVTTIRLARYGLKPIVGDLVVDKPGDDTLDNDIETVLETEGGVGYDVGDQLQSTEDEQLARGEASNDVKMSEKEGTASNEPTEQTRSGQSKDSKSGLTKRLPPKVHALTEEELERGEYTIYDVVLPLPGSDVLYPNNDIAQLYTTLMEEDGLSLEHLKHKQRDYRLLGNYRKIMARPRDLEWSFVLTQPNVDILPTDLDELTNKHNTELDSGYLSLRLGFTLPSSTYATMLIRQLTLQSTAPAYQKQLEIGDATK